MQSRDFRQIMLRFWAKREQEPPLEDEEYSLAEKNEQLKLELDSISALLDNLPFPLWTRDKELGITYRNKAYMDLLAQEPESATADVLDLAAQKMARQAQQDAVPCSENQLIALGGDIKLVQISEIPLHTEGALLGFAYEAMPVHTLAEQAVPEQYYNSATAIFDRDMNLHYYNDAFVKLWQIDSEFLNENPTYPQFLTRLRDERKLPEQANFQNFKQNRIRLFEELISPFHDCLYLPSGRTIQMEICRHSAGGLIFSYEDITERLSYERSFNMLTAVQQTVLEHLHEGVVVFGENGKLTYYNSIYAKLWRLKDEFLAGNPHISDVLEAVRPLYFNDNWSNFKADFIATLATRSSRRECIERVDGSVVERIFVPLPDGGTMISYLDITDLKLQKQAAAQENP
jgi:PAS domain-containing protein